MYNLTMALACWGSQQAFSKCLRDWVEDNATVCQYTSGFRQTGEDDRWCQ